MDVVTRGHLHDPGARDTLSQLAGVFGGQEAPFAAHQQNGPGERLERIVAAIGPMIRQPNYETGPELKSDFIAADPANARFFAPSVRPGHFLFDLAGYVAARLTAAGVETVVDLGACTYGEPDRFFSYRRMTHHGEPDYGRHVSAIVVDGAVA